jgi:hypothetical protein
MTTLPPDYIKRWLDQHELLKARDTLQDLKEFVQTNKRIVPEAYATDLAIRDELLSLLNNIETILESRSNKESK